MLSILIPTKDYTCYKLARDLHEQAEKAGVPYEIIVEEDGSRDRVSMIANHKITDLSNCRHIVREKCLGLATTRNNLAEQAQYEWILFIDSDAEVANEGYIATYLRHTDKAEVIIGGLETPKVNYAPNRTLRHKYESEADKHRNAETRMRHPYMQISCFNVMMRRSTFLQVKFDKDCHEYGYEDALFGVELEKRGISLLHIDNPLIHKGLDTNSEFLRKSETALRTLKSLNGKMDGHSHVENAYNKLRKYHLAWTAKVFHRLFGCLIRKQLMSRHPSLTLFSIYKLGYYSSL